VTRGAPAGPLASAEVSMKLFVEDPSAVRLKELIPVFHRWIREGLLEDELLIDVASYEHVPKGPGILLVCDKAHYSFDVRGARPGIRYRGRRESSGRSGEDKIARAFRSALQAASLLESEPTLEGRYRFRTSEVEFGIFDRLFAPSDERTLAAVRPALEACVRALYGEQASSIEMTSGPREPFAVSITTATSPTVEQLLGRLVATAPYTRVREPAKLDPLLEAALARFDTAHREDPRSLVADGVETPCSVHYHRRLTHWVLALDPGASDALRLAAACQHIRRWQVPRGEYEEGRRGYRRWRSDLSNMHARVARATLEEVGYDEEIVARVELLIRKIGLGRDPEVQLFEDAICLVFFETEYVDLARKHDDAKMVNILRQTWAKMSRAGRAAALTLVERLPERERTLVEAATSDGHA